ncbi:glycosyltransferase 87 family protein [Arthrobacter ramosus]|uniref:Glycosyltransferase 87 family protein n=1 Tax=Arthrobacter ramosus TaxID=1672 RepID=A0ABV5Y203_ARTRM
MASWPGEDVYARNLFGELLPSEGLPFVYTPFSAALLSVTSLLPAQTSFVLWTTGCVATLAFIIGVCLPRSLPRRRTIWLTLLLLGCCTTIVAQHLVWGQINLFLAGLCLADFVRHTNGRWSRFVPKGVLIGIAAGIKLTPAIFIPYLLITRQWRMAVSAVAGFAGTVIIGGILFPTMSVTYWFSDVWQLSSKVDLGTQFASAGNNSIQGAAAAIGHWAVSPSKVIVIVVAVLGLFAGAKIFRAGQMLAAVLAVGMTASLVSPVSWLHHWVYLIPALVVLWFLGRKPTRVFVAAAALVLLIHGTDLGEHMLQNGPTLLAPLGILLRESLLLISVSTIGLFLALRSRPSPPAAAILDHRPVEGIPART